MLYNKTRNRAAMPHLWGRHMISELRQVIRSIQENTGIEMMLYSSSGEPFSNTGKKISADFEGIRQDVIAGETYFKTEYKSTQLICAIKGCGPVEKNYAFLLTDMIENSASRVTNLSRNEFFKRILLGECSPSDVEKYRTKYAVPDLPCFVLAVSFEGKTSDVTALLSQYAENEMDSAVAVSGKECAVVKFVEEQSEYQSAADFAGFVVRSLLEELGIKAQAGVGGVVRRFEDINVSYQQAAAALRMSALFNSKGSVHCYRDFILIKMLEDIPEGKLGEYLSILLEGEARELLKDEDMVNTAEEFLENSLNVSETSRNLYMHRNTLMYRLDKIERVTGLNLRKFSDAVTFRIITILNKLV